MYKVLILLLTILLAGCMSTKPYRIEYYEPANDEERARGYGAYKVLDYKKPQGMITIFGFSIF